MTMVAILRERERDEKKKRSRVRDTTGLLLTILLLLSRVPAEAGDKLRVGQFVGGVWGAHAHTREEIGLGPCACGLLSMWSEHVRTPPVV